MSPGRYTLVASKRAYAEAIAAGCVVSDGVSTRVDFVLNSCTGNTLLNGSFESGFVGSVGRFWQAYSDLGCRAEPLVGADCAKRGSYSQKLRMPESGSEVHAGFWQAVDAVPGRPYGFLAWQRGQIGAEDSLPRGEIVCRLGLDPTGGTDYSSPTVVWQEFTPSRKAWSSAFGSAVAYADTVTLFLDVCRKRPGGGEECYVWFDGVRLTGPVKAPSAPKVRVERYSGDRTTVRAEWSCPDSDIDEYEYAVSTTRDSSGIVTGGQWASAGKATSATRTGLALEKTAAVRVLVRATNAAGVTSETGASEPVRIVSDAADVSSAKWLPDGAWVRISDVRVSRMGQGAECFVQDPRRIAGIRVIGERSAVPYVQPGTMASVVGCLATQDGMRVLSQAELMPSIAEGPVRPIGLRNSYVGGGDYYYAPGPPTGGQQGSAWGSGVNNVGLLVTVWGRVMAVGPGSFTIDDGSLSGGLKIRCHNSATLPKVGSHTRVTGISTPHGVSVYSGEDISRAD